MAAIVYCLVQIKPLGAEPGSAPVRVIVLPLTVSVTLDAAHLTILQAGPVQVV
jgi:hypothetical protein